MSFGVNRDYITTERAAKTNLAKHWARMQELIKQGLSREEASSQAFKELTKRKKK